MNGMPGFARFLPALLLVLAILALVTACGGKGGGY
jgi:predicted small lipoprotein YifL